MSKNILATKVVNGYTVNVFTDPGPSKPDKMTDQPVTLIANHAAFVHGKDCAWHKMIELYDKYCEDEDWVIAVLTIDYNGEELRRAPSTDALDDSSRHRAFIAVNKEDFIKYAMVSPDKHGDAELIQKEIEAYDWDKLINGVIAEWNTYLAREVLAFEVIDVNGNHVESVYGFYDTEAYVLSEAMNNVPDYETPKKEEWFAWREKKTVTGPNSEAEKRLLIPWSDPYLYENAADGLFEDAESAEKWKEEFAPHEDWWLCRQTTTPVSFHRAQKEENES